MSDLFVCVQQHLWKKNMLLGGDWKISNYFFKKMYTNWKSVEKGSCSAKLAASLGKQLSGGKSGTDVSTFL